ncbi:MAG TPA: hypothetical protein VHV47_02955, partial [Opitutaceae bacterium]|nr:hypothetical protein [Opitutaceae bacterium]
LPWLAWIGALGNPARAVRLYAALNPLFWLGYAALLLALFRGRGWAGVAGLAAMLLTCGVVESIYRTLTDFPAFVLMTGAAVVGGVSGAGLIALSALTREVNLLGIAGLLETKPPWGRALLRNLLMVLAAALPLALWFCYVSSRMRTGGNMAGGNLDWPLRAVLIRLGESVAWIRRHGVHGTDWIREPTEAHALLTIVATLTQCVYLWTHPRWDDRLWRIAAVFSVFFLCVSSNVWGGVAYFTVTRHALPITLAFNLGLAARPSRAWLAWFVLGNCFVPAGICEFVRFGAAAVRPPEFTIQAAAEVAPRIAVEYGPGWSNAEWDGRQAWRWAVAGNAVLVLTNSGDRPLRVGLTFDCSSLTARGLAVSAGGKPVWSGRIGAKPESVPVRTENWILPPGRSEVVFASPEAPAPPRREDPRRLVVQVADLVVAAAPSP